MDIQTIIFSVLGTVLSALAAWAVERLVTWLNTKIKDNKTLTLLTDAIGVVTAAAKATYQTYVQALKEKNAFDADAQKEALNKAIAQATETMTAESKEYITKNFGDLSAWISLQIEAVLYDLKNKATSEGE